MKFIEKDGVLQLAKEEGENIVMSVFTRSHTIIVGDGFERIAKHAFRSCKNLKILHLPKSVTYLGDEIFQEKYSEVEIIYEGSSEDFKKMDLEREVYVSGSYDHYPYYSDYGATYETERFYSLYDNYEMWCEVWCKQDNVRLTYGSKTKHRD